MHVHIARDKSIAGKDTKSGPTKVQLLLTIAPAIIQLNLQSNVDNEFYICPELFMDLISQCHQSNQLMAVKSHLSILNSLSPNHPFFIKAIPVRPFKFLFPSRHITDLYKMEKQPRSVQKSIKILSLSQVELHHVTGSFFTIERNYKGINKVLGSIHSSIT